MVLVGKGFELSESGVNIKAKTEHSKARVGILLFRWRSEDKYVHKRGTKDAAFKDLMALPSPLSQSTVFPCRGWAMRTN